MIPGVVRAKFQILGAAIELAGYPSKEGKREAWTVGILWCAEIWKKERARNRHGSLYRQRNVGVTRSD